MFDFTGKVVLVTGGSRGLGKAMSLGFAEQGATVIIVSRKQGSCTALAEQIVQAGGQAVGIAANTGKTDDIDALVRKLKADYARIDLLINNAGTNIALGPLTDLSPKQFDKMFQVNLRGPWYLASRIAPIMAATGGGSIINILSVAALRPPAYNGFYAATKSGLEAMTKVMAQEWANDKIRVNAIAPGPYRSDLVDSSIAAIPNFEEGMRNSTLLKRIAETDEILKPVFYLASDGNITGTTLIADGGLTANQ